MDKKVQEYIGIAVIVAMAILLLIFALNYEPTPKLTSKQVDRLNTVIIKVDTFDGKFQQHDSDIKNLHSLINILETNIKQQHTEDIKHIKEIITLLENNHKLEDDELRNQHTNDIQHLSNIHSTDIQEINKLIHTINQHIKQNDLTLEQHNQYMNQLYDLIQKLYKGVPADILPSSPRR